MGCRDPRINTHNQNCTEEALATLNHLQVFYLAKMSGLIQIGNEGATNRKFSGQLVLLTLGSFQEWYFFFSPQEKQL